MDTEDVLETIYYDPANPGSLGGVDRLLREARKRIKGIKRQDVVEFLERQDTYTRHKDFDSKFEKRKVIATNICDVYQMDLVDLQKFAEKNDGIKYLLTCVDCFTRYAFVIPLKSKKAQDIINAMVQIFKAKGIPLKIFTDKGTEFLNKDVKLFLKELGVQQWYSYMPGKAVMAERFNRTLKERMWRWMTYQNNYRYIDALDKAVKSYNSTIHSSTGYAPSDITDDDVLTILDRMESPHDPPRAAKFEMGDRVRVAVSKLAFEKGYEERFSTLIFKVVAVRRSSQHYLYKLADLADKVEPGWFYEAELTRVRDNPRAEHRINKIVKQRKVKGRLQYLINWVGYPSAFDSWEWADELQ